MTTKFRILAFAFLITICQTTFSQSKKEKALTKAMKMVLKNGIRKIKPNTTKFIEWFTNNGLKLCDSNKFFKNQY